MELKKFLVKIHLSVVLENEQVRYEFEKKEFNAENLATDLEHKHFIRVTSPNGKNLTTINMNHISEIEIVEIEE